jgi:hypothetical protein
MKTKKLVKLSFMWFLTWGLVVAGLLLLYLDTIPTETKLLLVFPLLPLLGFSIYLTLKLLEEVLP